MSDVLRIGIKIDRVTLIDTSGRLWKGRCDCGIVTMFRVDQLRRASKFHKVACGCSKAGYRNLIGIEYQRLTVIERMRHLDKDKSMWRCLCSCGNHINVSGVELNRGMTRSCGCLLRDTAAINALDAHIALAKKRQMARKGL